jgi:polyhydroxyalkanoate synthesis regulator phasin
MAQTKTATGRVAEQAERLRTELRKLPLVRRLEQQGERAARGAEQRLDSLLDRLPIATKRRVERAERRLTGLTRKIRKLEKTSAS